MINTQKIVLFSCLVLMQAWMNFNFPAFVRLGSSISVILGLLATIGTTFIYMAILRAPELYTPLVTLSFFDGFPHAMQIKTLFKRSMFLLWHILVGFFWYIDYYAMSNAWYLLWYAHGMFSTFLVYLLVGQPQC